MTEIKLQDIPLFSEMDDEEIAGIRAIMDELKYQPGQTIVREGEPGDLFYVITEGIAQVSIVDAGGEEIVLDQIKPGGFFGELSMLTGEPRSARVKALDHVTTLVLQRDELFDFLRGHPGAAIDVLVELGGRLHNINNRVRSMVSRNVNEVAEERMTLGQRVADSVSDTMGSWRFIIFLTTFIIIWLILNLSGWIKPWDPTLLLLNLMLSLQAAYAAPFIMMSQNRQSAKDRLVAEIDHQVNSKAELEIGMLLQRLDDLEKAVQENHRELHTWLKK